MVTPSNNRSTGVARPPLRHSRARGLHNAGALLHPCRALVAILRARASGCRRRVRDTRARLGLVQPDFDSADRRGQNARIRNSTFRKSLRSRQRALCRSSRISMAAEASANYSRGVSVLFRGRRSGRGAARLCDLCATRCARAIMSRDDRGRRRRLPQSHPGSRQCRRRHRASDATPRRGRMAIGRARRASAAPSIRCTAIPAAT